MEGSTKDWGWGLLGGSWSVSLVVEENRRHELYPLSIWDVLRDDRAVWAARRTAFR